MARLSYIPLMPPGRHTTQRLDLSPQPGRKRHLSVVPPLFHPLENDIPLPVSAASCPPRELIARPDPTRFRRRALSLPLFAALWTLALATAPLWLLATLATDAMARGRTATLRASLFFAWYLSCEVVGVLAALALWLVGWALPRELATAWHYEVQLAWARALLGAATFLFRLTYDVEGDGESLPGPIVMLVRHVSVADTLLPAVFATGRHGLRLRYVLKRELLWDPCLDVVGNRLPNAFVARGSDDSAKEIAKVRALAGGLAEDEGVLLFPEGTRFTADKRARVVERLSERGSPRMLAAARALQNVLPPQLGGVTAVLEAAPSADVVFCAHTGFEGISTLRELMDGSLVGRRIHVRFWRVPRLDVPDSADARVDWLLARWAEVDAWIATARDSDAVTDEARAA